MSNVIEDLVTIPEAAALAGVAPNTIRNWESAGRITLVGVVGKRIKVFRRSEVLAARELVSSPVLDGHPISAASDAA